MILTGQGKLNECFFQLPSGAWALRVNDPNSEESFASVLSILNEIVTKLGPTDIDGGSPSDTDYSFVVDGGTP